MWEDLLSIYETWTIPSCNTSLFFECMDCGCKLNVQTLLHGLQKFLKKLKKCFNLHWVFPLPSLPHIKPFVTNWEILCTQWATQRLSAGGFYWELTEGSLANVQKPTLTCLSLAWDLVFSRILLTCLSACQANQQTPNEPTLKKQTLSQPTSFSYVLWGWRDKTS